ELSGARRVLSAAAMTYLAACFSALLQQKGLSLQQKVRLLSIILFRRELQVHGNLH
ncbi:MAG TPA: hypothetical protein DEP27_05845, partial [Ruminococcaceae bacterium]|nr:hypothetical protein [Oscillospiraceae bacterium]